jgi:hypothetical protein
MRPKLAKTSVQLAEDTLARMDAWPGLTRSEAIRLSVERAYYFASLESEQTADLFNIYRAILDGALQEFDYDDFRTVARALPAIVEGYVWEHRNADWRHPYDDRQTLDASELLQKLRTLTPYERIGLLDCAVARRQDKAAAATAVEQAKRHHASST